MQNLRNAEAPATSAREGRDVTLGRGMALGVKLPIWRSDPLSIERTITRTRTRLFDAWSLSRNLLGFYGGGAHAGSVQTLKAPPSLCLEVIGGIVGFG